MTTMLMPPFEYFVFDVETTNGRPEDVERFFRETWSPNKDWKDETIGKRFHEAHAKMLEKSAVLDCAGLACVAFKSESQLCCLHCLSNVTRARPGVVVAAYPNMAAMLAALADVMNTYVGPDTTLAGHNIKGFDLRRIRREMCRASVPLPHALLHRDQPVFDVMSEYCSRYSVSREIMVSLDVILGDFGIESHKRNADGTKVSAMVGELIEAGNHDEVIDLALCDVLAEELCFLRMIGRTPLAAAPVAP